MSHKPRPTPAWESISRHGTLLVDLYCCHESESGSSCSNWLGAIFNAQGELRVYFEVGMAPHSGTSPQRQFLESAALPEGQAFKLDVVTWLQCTDHGDRQLKRADVLAKVNEAQKTRTPQKFAL